MLKGYDPDRVHRLHIIENIAHTGLIRNLTDPRVKAPERRVNPDTVRLFLNRLLSLNKRTHLQKGRRIVGYFLLGQHELIVEGLLLLAVLLHGLALHQTLLVLQLFRAEVGRQPAVLAGHACLLVQQVRGCEAFGAWLVVFPEDPDIAQHLVAQEAELGNDERI
jgi:hypothetical protein